MKIIIKGDWYKIYEKKSKYFISCDCGEAISTGWQEYELSKEQVHRVRLNEEEVEQVILEIQNS